MTSVVPEMENRNIAAWLPRMAAEHGDMRGVVVSHAPDRMGRTSYTFAELEAESQQIAAGLVAYGISKGTRTVLMVTPSLEFFALTFALFKVGAVPVLVDPGMGLKNLKQCLQEAEPEAFIGIPKAHIARIVLRWPKVPILITVGRKFLWSGITLENLRELGAQSSFDMPKLGDEDRAAILFTSGSTGVPKGAIYTHGIFQAQVAILRRIYEIKPGEVDLATFPLFALFAPALGMTAIVPNMDFTRPAMVDPEHIISLVQDEKVTNMFGSPALLNRVGRYGAAKHVQLTTLKRVISAGAPVPAATMETFGKMLPEGVQIFTPYGATESLPVASIGSQVILDETAALTARGAGVCVGHPVDEIRLEIIRIDDRPIEMFSGALRLAQGKIGEIAVKGPMVTHAYFNREGSTRIAKMRDPEDGGIWHRMGDLGYRDEQGRVWFCGRKAHRVPTNNGTLFSVACEGIFNNHPAVFRTALVGVTDKNGTETPVLCVEMEKSFAGDLDNIRNELLALGDQHDITRHIRKILFHPSFPVDIRHNAKIFREKLAIWAAQ